VHGGLLPEHSSYGLEKINEEVRDWVKGLTGQLSPEYCRSADGLLWLRKFSRSKVPQCDCSALEHVLATVPGVKRMVMGHSIQRVGINGACDDKAIRIDVGLSKGCGDGLPEVLEISRNFGLRILTEDPLYQNKGNATMVDVGKEQGLGLLLGQQGGPKQVEVQA